jgi:hypothetical protein
LSAESKEKVWDLFKEKVWDLFSRGLWRTTAGEIIVYIADIAVKSLEVPAPFSRVVCIISSSHNIIYRYK